MRFDRLDLNLLVALDVLLEERSVSASAKRLNLSQPALSGALQRLRAFFDDDLLVQMGRAMVLTAKGEELIQPVRRALMFIRTAITTPTSFDPATVERRFVVVASDYAVSTLIADVIAHVAGVAPAVTFDIIPTDRSTPEMLERGEADLVMSIDAYLSPAHPKVPLFDDEHAVICWADGPYRDGISATDFYGARHVVAFFGPQRYPAFTESYFSEKGVERRIDVRVPSFSMLPRMIVGTGRIATMYRRHAEHFARSLPIAVHPAPVPLPNVVEAMQWHTMRERDQGLLWLIRQIREMAETMA